MVAESTAGYKYGLDERGVRPRTYMSSKVVTVVTMYLFEYLFFFLLMNLLFILSWIAKQQLRDTPHLSYCNCVCYLFCFDDVLFVFGFAIVSLLCS